MAGACPFFLVPNAVMLKRASSQPILFFLTAIPVLALFSSLVGRNYSIPPISSP